MMESTRQELLNQISQLDQSTSQVLKSALTLAEQTHAGQFRKPRPERPDQRDPYIIHPIRVALILLSELNLRETSALAAALLHDCIEDSDGRVTAQQLTEQFGDEVATIVDILSKPPYMDGVPRHQQLSIYHDRVANASELTRFVKLADRLDNIREALLTDDRKFQHKYLVETRDIYLPLAAATSEFFYQHIAQHCEQLAALLAQQGDK